MMRLALALALSLAVVGCSGNDEDAPTTRPSSVPAWFRNGTGNTVFDKPIAVRRVRIGGSFSGSGSNFIVWCGPNLLVNELLGRLFGPLSYEGTHAADNCTEVRIENSNGVAWTFTEVR